VLHHLKHAVTDERNVILIVGFQAEHTLGRRLVEGRDPVRIFGREYRLRAEVRSIQALSAHADRGRAPDLGPADPAGAARGLRGPRRAGTAGALRPRRCAPAVPSGWPCPLRVSPRSSDRPAHLPARRGSVAQKQRARPRPGPRGSLRTGSGVSPWPWAWPPPRPGPGPRPSCPGRRQFHAGHAGHLVDRRAGS